MILANEKSKIENLIKEFLNWAKDDKELYQKSLVILKQWHAIQSDEIDLFEFMEWLNRDYLK